MNLKSNAFAKQNHYEIEKRINYYYFNWISTNYI